MLKLVKEEKGSMGKKQKTTLRPMMKDQKQLRIKKIHLISINLLHKRRKLLRTCLVHQATGDMDLHRDG